MQGASESARPAPVGRPRNSQIDEAVLCATIEVLEETGYHRFALEQVARRAGTTKPTIYRRWPTRQHLVLAALAGRLGQLPVPDTSCTICDLAECLSVFAAAFQRLPPDVLGSLLSDCADNPDLRAEFMNSLFDPPRRAVEQTLLRAIRRGDLRSDLDLDLTLDQLGSLVHYRALFRHAQTTDAEIERAVENMLCGIATDYPALVEHNRRLSAEAQAHAHHIDG
ncbi:TetR/AcrR family transcriptional regulator [Phytoactinopolyspora halotolerans]|uniref:TetR/AcrR family transcriptional regulator n=1 Tax=Phytoactinopolyspora halotolerans TaxID=1981512 RepID=A0A6L9SB61_9ACTN|nr:TetR/AcrR family transcriptional regulator [Phytoactinopolyspora halotolerans]NEE02595.1 TetR/AcrR family transcriptional regulator [Phytoactinopolyspora halotolerans]